jgi:hypothetical protein
MASRTACKTPLRSLAGIGGSRSGFEVDDATAQLRGHLMRVTLGEIEFLSDLLVRQIEN